MCEYIVVKETIDLVDAAANQNDKHRQKNITFKNNAAFMSCTSNINNTFKDIAEDRDIVIPMYNK